MTAGGTRLPAGPFRHRRRRPATPWMAYVGEFHARRPGITEDVLSRSRSSGDLAGPYQWLLEALPPERPVLDLACGSAPLSDAIGGWVGADRSPAELARAMRRGAWPLVRADGGHLPFGGEAFAAVACSMAIMVMEPPAAVVGEIRRVLRPGGTAAFLLPGSRPLTAGDLVRYGRLMTALGLTHLAYPNDRATARLHRVLRHGLLDPVADDRRRFAYSLTDAAAARRFVGSLYLRDVPERRIERALELAEGWVGAEIGIPIRRVVVRAR